MNDFKRLLDDESTDATPAELLRFARHERPSPEGRARIIDALAARAGLAAIEPETLTARSSSLPAPAKGLHIATPFKLGFLGLVALAVPFAAWLMLRDTQAPAAAPPSRMPTAVVKAAVLEPVGDRAGPGPREQQNERAKPASSSAVPVEELPVSRSAAPNKPAPSALTGSSLADEVKALARAKGALSSGNPGQALRELDAYRTQFPAGKLRQEATVTRIEALAQSGEGAAAKRLGERFLSHSGKSPYAARVRSLIGM